MLGDTSDVKVRGFPLSSTSAQFGGDPTLCFPFCRQNLFRNDDINGDNMISWDEFTGYGLVFTCLASVLSDTDDTHLRLLQSQG